MLIFYLEYVTRTVKVEYWITLRPVDDSALQLAKRKYVSEGAVLPQVLGRE